MINGIAKQYQAKNIEMAFKYVIFIPMKEEVVN